MRKEVTTFFRALLFTERCKNTLISFWWAVEQQPVEEFSIRHFQQIIPGCTGCKFGVFLNISEREAHVIQPSNHTFEWMSDIAHYQLYPRKAALSAILTKSGSLDFPFSCSPILFFCVATSLKWFLASTHVWTAIESVNFTDFVLRAAIAIIAHGERFWGYKSK